MFSIIKLSSTTDNMSVSINKQELAIAVKQSTIVAKSLFHGIRTGFITVQETYKELNK